MAEQHFSVTNRILCEEVRQEKSNKYILLGVFSGDILVERFPADVALSLFIEGQVQTHEEGDLHIRLSGPGEGSAVLVAHYKPDEGGGKTVALATPRLNVRMEQSGIFKVELSEDAKNWETIIEKSVSLGQNLWTLSPILPLPPSAQSPRDAPAS